MAVAYDYDKAPQTLENELAELLRCANLRGRQARAVAARLGWDGEGLRTLAAAATVEGYSRERVRQLEERVRAHVRQSPQRVAATEAALRLIEDAAPLTSRGAAERLATAGVSQRPFDIAGVLSAAELLGLGHCIETGEGVVLHTAHAHLPAKAALLARRLVVRNGAGNINALSSELGSGATPTEVQLLLELRGDVTWLDDHRTWFVIAGTGGRAARTLRKMLSIAPTLTVSDIDHGLRRSLRPVVLPREIVRLLCESQRWLRVDREDDTVTARTPLDQARVLSPIERKLVEVFRRAGPTLTFSRALALAERDDISMGSVRFYLSRTPLLHSRERGQYTLVGQAA
jgi:hypothetical protein